MGKSSIIKCVKNELKDKHPNIIFCQIDTWGANDSVISSVVLGKVINRVAEFIDVSPLLNLPTQYTDALKLGNNAFKLISIFTGGNVDPKKGLEKLNKILKACNKKLVISIEDLDRHSKPQKSCAELAALLDKLKNLENISFIIAIGADEIFSETLRKVCDYREDLIKIDYSQIIIQFMKVCVKEAFRKDLHVYFNKTIDNILAEMDRDYLKGIHSINPQKIEPFELIKSMRSLKSICRRVDEIWQEDKLMGEIDVKNLFLIAAIREEDPFLFDFVKSNLKEIENIFSHPLDNIEVGKFLDELQQSYNKKLDSELIKTIFNCLIYNDTFVKQPLYSKTINKVNYFNRILLETVPESEVKDQYIINLLTKIKDSKTKITELLENLQGEKSENWIEGFLRFHTRIWDKENLFIYQEIFIKMAAFYENEGIEYLKFNNSYFVTQDYLSKNFILELSQTILSFKYKTIKNKDESSRLFLEYFKYSEIYFGIKKPIDAINTFFNEETKDKLFNKFIKQIKSSDLFCSAHLQTDNLLLFCKLFDPNLKNVEDSENSDIEIIQECLIVLSERYLAIAKDKNKESDIFTFSWCDIVSRMGNWKFPEGVFSADELKKIKDATNALYENYPYHAITNGDKDTFDQKDKIINLLKDAIKVEESSRLEPEKALAVV